MVRICENADTQSVDTWGSTVYTISVNVICTSYHG